MERITYAAGSVLTGNDIAHAIVEYAKALALSEQSDTVTFPVVLDDGSTDMAEVLIGPASQLLAVPEHTDRQELTNPDLVSHLVAKARALGPSHPVPDEDPLPDLDYNDY